MEKYDDRETVRVKIEEPMKLIDAGGEILLLEKCNVR